MNAQFSIGVDVTRDLVRLKLSGFFAVADVERFCEARDAAHRQLTCAPHAHVTLVDLRDMKIQPQESVSAFGSLLADPAHQSRKLALVFSLSLARMQLQRAAGDRRARYFTSIADAEAWLFEAEKTFAR